MKKRSTKDLKRCSTINLQQYRTKKFQDTRACMRDSMDKRDIVFDDDMLAKGELWVEFRNADFNALKNRSGILHEIDGLF